MKCQGGVGAVRRSVGLCVDPVEHVLEAGGVLTFEEDGHAGDAEADAQVADASL